MKNKLATSIVIVILVLSSLSILAVPARAVSATLVSTPSSPSGKVSIQTGVSFYNGFEYSVSYYYGTVFKVALTGLTSSNLTSHTSSILNRIFFALAVDTTSGNLAATRRIVGNDLTPDGLSVISTSTGAITDVLDGLTGAPNYQNEFDGVGYCSSNFYVAAGSVLFKVQSTSPFSVTQYSTGIGPQNTGYYGFRCDGSGNVWFTEYLSGNLCKFNGSTVTCYSGFLRPSDVAIVGTTGYVAENNAGGNIRTVNLATGSITATTATSGTPYGLTVVGSTPYWADNSAGKQICQLGGPCIGTTEQPAFLTTDGVNVIFGFVGSDGVGSLPASAFTLSSSSSSSSSSSATATSASSSTTSSSAVSTNECGGNVGGMCQYPQQVIPSITFNSTGVGGQHNIYLTHNGTQRVSGFEWFPIGGSSGDFLFFQFISLLGCCGWESSPSPSLGTFASATFSVSNYQPVNGTYEPRPVAQLGPNPSTLVVGQTHYGWLCGDGYIAKNALGCDNGEPIEYRTFSANIVVSLGRNVVNFQATGTQSGTQISQENIIIDYPQG